MTLVYMQIRSIYNLMLRLRLSAVKFPDWQKWFLGCHKSAFCTPKGPPRDRFYLSIRFPIHDAVRSLARFTLSSLCYTRCFPRLTIVIQTLQTLWDFRNLSSRTIEATSKQTPTLASHSDLFGGTVAQALLSTTEFFIVRLLWIFFSFHKRNPLQP